jgi:hypothetical protein
MPKFFFLENKKKLSSQILRYFFGNQTAKFNYGHKAWLFEQNIFSLFENGQKKCPISKFPKNFPNKNLEIWSTCVGTFFGHFLQKFDFSLQYVVQRSLSSIISILYCISKILKHFFQQKLLWQFS